VIVQPGPP